MSSLETTRAVRGYPKWHHTSQRAGALRLTNALWQAVTVLLLMLPLSDCGGGNPSLAQAIPPAIVFTSFRILDGSNASFPNTKNIWGMLADGSGAAALTKLTISTARSELAVWSPDGRQVAYVSNRALDGRDALNSDPVNSLVHAANIWVMNADGSGARPLTKLMTTDCVRFPDRSSLLPAAEGSLVWSPDGSKLAFTSFRALDGSDSEGTGSNLWVMNADGSGQTPITRLTGSLIEEIEWSPDSRKLAFVSPRALDGGPGPERDNNIWVINVDGTGTLPLTKLTALGGDCRQPAWSPDGSKLAFFSSRALDGSDVLGPPTTNIWVMNADGSAAKSLTKLTARGSDSQHPVWSPDGSQLAFTSSRALDGSDAANILPGSSPSFITYIQNVWVMRADGTNTTPLTKLTRVNNSFGNHFVWSLDGAKLAFDSAQALDGSDAPGEGINIWVMNADGSGLLPITKLTGLGLGADNAFPAWRPK